MDRFYYGLTGSGSDKKMGDGHVPHVFISAATLWDKKYRRWKKLYPPTFESLFLDSGGFSWNRDHCGYPFSVEQYAELAVRLNATFVATLDLPCEPGVNRYAHSTNEERIRRTVQQAVVASELFPNLLWVPVIQGYTVDEYLSCIDLYREVDAVRPYMAVGSLCTRNSAGKTWEVLRAIRARIPGVRLHGFGVSLALLKDRRIRTALWSADSQAWRFFTHWSPELGKWIWKPRTFAAQLDNYPRYAAKVNRLIDPGGPRITAFAEAMP
jgi:hypothetical protein